MTWRSCAKCGWWQQNGSFCSGCGSRSLQAATKHRTLSRTQAPASGQLTKSLGPVNYSHDTLQQRWDAARKSSQQPAHTKVELICTACHSRSFNSKTECRHCDRMYSPPLPVASFGSAGRRAQEIRAQNCSTCTDACELLSTCGCCCSTPPRGCPGSLSSHRLTAPSRDFQHGETSQRGRQLCHWPPPHCHTAIFAAVQGSTGWAQELRQSFRCCPGAPQSCLRGKTHCCLQAPAGTGICHPGAASAHSGRTGRVEGRTEPCRSAKDPGKPPCTTLPAQVAHTVLQLVTAQGMQPDHLRILQQLLQIVTPASDPAAPSPAAPASDAAMPQAPAASAPAPPVDLEPPPSKQLKTGLHGPALSAALLPSSLPETALDPSQRGPASEAGSAPASVHAHGGSICPDGAGGMYQHAACSVPLRKM